MNTKPLRHLLAALTFLALAACGGHGHGVDDEPVVVDPPVDVPAPTMHIAVSAVDLGGVPLADVDAGVVMPAGGAASAPGVRTDAAGEGGFDAPLARRTVVRFSKAGYAETWKQVSLETGSTGALARATMLPREPAQSFDAGVGGTLDGKDGARVVVPAGALVDAATGAAVSGMVDLAMTPVDVSGDGLRAFPGSFAGTDAAGATGLLASYGTTEFAFSQGGRRLNLAAGQTASIDLPIYTPLHSPGVAVVVGDTIPLWSLDETSGIWKQEGTGTVVASATSPTGLAMRATVAHFSWWNCDVSVDLGHADVDIRLPDVADKDKVPVDDPKVVGDINADPNLYTIGIARVVHIDGRTADDSFLRQAGIDFEAAFKDEASAATRNQALAANPGRRQPQGATLGVTTGLILPAGRDVSLTACALVQRGGTAFAPTMACGTVVTKAAKDQTVKVTIQLVLGPISDVAAITRHPVAMTVMPGQTATFSVAAVHAADSTAPLVYQWTRNGVQIAGATADTYTTPATTLADNGSLFGVVVSAPAGTSISYPARLTVAEPPPPPPPPDAGTDRWVDAVNGNDANDGSVAAPLRTISAAVAVVKSGGTIWLNDGIWTSAIDPGLGKQSIGINCTGNSLPAVTGTSFRAVNPGQATLRYASIIGLCVGDSQVRGLRLEVETMLNNIVAIQASAPGANLISGVSFQGGILLVGGGARLTLEPAGLATYGDLGDLSGRAAFVRGAGSEIVVNGGSFDRLSSLNSSGGTTGPGCSSTANFYAVQGAQLVFNQVDLRAGPARNSNAIFDVAVAGCDNAQIELNATTISGFVRGAGINIGVAASINDGSSLTLGAGTTLSGNHGGIYMTRGSVALSAGALIQGSTTSGIYINSGYGVATLTLASGSAIQGSTGSAIDVHGSSTNPPRLDVSGAIFANNGGAGVHVTATAQCRIRDSSFVGNLGYGVQMESLGGICDLGTVASPGGNTFANTGPNVSLNASSTLPSTLQAVGNTWAANQQGSDAQGRYAVPNGQTVLEVAGPVTSGANYRLNAYSRIRLAE
jgi:Right handed beta helix region/Protein of unknown function (DUF1565)